MDHLRLGSISLDTTFGILSGPVGRHRLTGDPARILQEMLTHPGLTFSNESIHSLCTVRDATATPPDVLVKSRISRCRGLLGRVGGPTAADMLQTERGFGYRLVVPRIEMRLNEQQAALLDGLLASHPDQAAVGLFRMAEFSRSAREVAALRADQAANGIRLDSVGAA